MEDGATLASLILIKIGSQLEVLIHGIRSRITINMDIIPVLQQEKLIKEIIKINPDIIHLHNIHGYYLNFKILFDFLLNITNQSYGHSMTAGVIQDIVHTIQLLDVINGKINAINAPI